MNSFSATASALAASFLAGRLDEGQLVKRGACVMGKRWRWLRPLARRVVHEFADRTRPRRSTLTRFILSDFGFRRACTKHDLRLDNLLARPTMLPVAAAASWTVPWLRTAGQLAQWLQLSIPDLEWFADLRRLESKCNLGRLRHYHYRALTKRWGRRRLIEAPKPRLKQIQRRILSGILEHIPAHEAAHGFRSGRSILSFAEPHVGRQVVLKLDLEDFFPSITAAQVQATFRTVGYPEEVSDLLGGLCTNSVPADVWPVDGDRLTGAAAGNTSWRYSQPHLPQGAPTSPAMANLCAFRLDCRLAGLARSAGANYTRYADDLAFSGDRDFERGVKRFAIHVSATAMEEGFDVHHRKTRVMKRGVRQRLVGMVVNDRLNLSREDFDRLKATLTNCLRHGAESQNRSGRADFRSHLQGRIAFLESVNPAKGHRLRKLFGRIEW